MDEDLHVTKTAAAWHEPANRIHLERCMTVHHARVLMPVGHAADGSAQLWTEVYERIFKPAIEKGFGDAFGTKTDRIETARLLGGKRPHAEWLADLASARFVLADVTGNDPQVLWALGVRQALKSGTLVVCMHPEEQTPWQPPAGRPGIPDLSVLPYRLGASTASVRNIARVVDVIARDPCKANGPVRAVLDAKSHSWVVPSDRLRELFSCVAKVFTEVGSFCNPTFESVLEVIVGELIHRDGRLGTLREGVLPVSRFTPLPNIVKGSYSGATHIRCTSVRSFEPFWSDSYGEHLLECSQEVKRKGGSTTRIFTGLTKDEALGRKALFRVQKRYGVDVFVLIEDNGKGKREAAAGRLLRQKLRKRIPFLGQEGIDTAQVELDLMLVDDLCGAIIGLSRALPQISDVEIDEDRLLGVFFHKAGRVGGPAYNVLEEVFAHLLKESLPWEKLFK